MSLLEEMLDHFSASAISTYLRCPTQWYFRYIEGVKIPPAAAQAQGTSFHRTAEENYRLKIDTHEDMPLEYLLDVTRDAFAEASEDVDWSLEDVEPAEAVDEAIGLTRVWHKELAPIVQPIAVERKLVIEDPSWLLPVIGYVDTDTVFNIIDHKTAGKRKTQADLETDVQSSIYLLDGFKEFSAQTFQWHVMVKNKTPVTQVLNRETFDPEKTVKFVAHQQKVIANAVETGLFGAADPSDWSCSPRFCGYWFICPWGAKK
jgi:hypothetical protein